MSVKNKRKTGVHVDKQNREKDDFYPTCPQAVYALLDKEKFEGDIWEPACGDGAISKILEEKGHEVISTDLVDRGYGKAGVDFLMEYRALAPNIITNPPFKLADEFMWKSDALAEGKVAMLLPLRALEGLQRRKIFDTTPLVRVWVFSGRITMHRSGIVPVGKKEGGMMAFAWFVWDYGNVRRTPTIGWL